MKIRGYFALGIICLAFLVCDIVQRTVIAFSARFRPGRVQVLGRWIQLMASLVVGGLSRLGGATIQVPPRIVPTGPGVLVVMNHQSLLDIPLVVKTLDGGYPRIVTRARYSRFIPLISHMIRLYQYPVVDPTAKAAEVRRSLESIAESAKSAQVPIALFPEGTRSRDGSIGRLRRWGLSELLAARDWTVYVFVADGYWKVATFKDFVGGLPEIRGTMAHVGTLEWSDPEADPGEFIDRVHALLVDGLAALRAGDPVEPTEA